MSQQPARYQRTFPGLVGALLVLVLVVLGFVGFRALIRSDVQSPVRAVDYAESLEYWQSQARFEILAPSSLPAGWRATSARFVSSRPQSWHLGVLTDSERYIGVEQRRSDVASMVAEFVDPEAVAGPEVEIAGTTWRAFSDAGGDRAVARREGGLTTLVVGTVSQEQLVSYVETLR